MDNNLHLRNKLRAESELPENLSWENIENGIVSKITPSTTSTQQKLSTSSKTKFWIFGSVILLLAIASICFYNNSNKLNNQNLISQADLTQESTSAIAKKKTIINQEIKTVSKSNDSSNASLQLNESQIATTEIKLDEQENEKIAKVNSHLNQNISSGNISETIHQHSAETNANTSVISNEKQKAIKQNAVGQTIEKTQLDKPSQSKPSELNVDQTSTKEKFAPSSITKKKTKFPKEPQSKIFEPLALLITQSNLLELSAGKIVSAPELSEDAFLIEPKVKNKLLSIELGTGFNYLTPIHSGNQIAMDVGTFESGIIGNTYNININYALNPTWSITTGISYKSLKSKFDFYETFDTMVLEKDVVTKITYNNLDGTSEAFVEDIELPTTGFRQVVHYNKHKFVSIPLLINRHWTTNNKFSLATGLGMNYSFNGSHSGRTILGNIENSERFEIGQIEDQDLYKKSSWSLLSQLKLEYKLSESYYVGANVQAGYHLTNWNTQANQNLNPIEISSAVNLGVRF